MRTSTAAPAHRRHEKATPLTPELDRLGVVWNPNDQEVVKVRRDCIAHRLKIGLLESTTPEQNVAVREVWKDLTGKPLKGRSGVISEDELTDLLITCQEMDDPLTYDYVHADRELIMSRLSLAPIGTQGRDAGARRLAAVFADRLLRDDHDRWPLTQAKALIKGLRLSQCPTEIRRPRLINRLRRDTPRDAASPASPEPFDVDANLSYAQGIALPAYAEAILLLASKYQDQGDILSAGADLRNARSQILVRAYLRLAHAEILGRGDAWLPSVSVRFEKIGESLPNDRYRFVDFLKPTDLVRRTWGHADGQRFDAMNWTISGPAVLETAIRDRIRSQKRQSACDAEAAARIQELERRQLQRSKLAVEARANEECIRRQLAAGSAFDDITGD